MLKFQLVLYDLDENVFNSNGPIGGYNSVAATVSSYLGINGPWGGVFDATGCCDDVVIDCYSKCGIYRNCGSSEEFRSEHIGSTTKITTSKIEQYKDEIFESNDLTIPTLKLERQSYPNPNAGSEIKVRLNHADQFNRIVIFDGIGNQAEVANWVRQGTEVTINPDTELASGLLMNYPAASGRGINFVL